MTTQHVKSLNEERNDSRKQSGSGETLSPSWLRDVFSINWTTGPPNPRNHTASPAHVMLIHSLTLFQVLFQNSTVHLPASSGAEVSLRGCDTYPGKGADLLSLQLETMTQEPPLGLCAPKPASTLILKQCQPSIPGTNWITSNG